MCALFLRFLGEKLDLIQWCCIILQCAGVVIADARAPVCVDDLLIASNNGTATQSDADDDSAYVYLMLAASVSISVASTLCNDRIIKQFEGVPLQQINMIMYMGGIAFAAGAPALGLEPSAGRSSPDLLLTPSGPAHRGSLLSGHSGLPQEELL